MTDSMQLFYDCRSQWNRLWGSIVWFDLNSPELAGYILSGLCHDMDIIDHHGLLDA